MDQPCRHHPGACYTWKFSGPISDQLIQNLPSSKIPRWFVCTWKLEKDCSMLWYHFLSWWEYRYSFLLVLCQSRRKQMPPFPLCHSRQQQYQHLVSPGWQETQSSSSCYFSLPFLKASSEDFPGGAEVKNPPANAGDTSSIPGPGRSHMPWSN